MKALFKKHTKTITCYKCYLVAQRKWAEKMSSLTDGLSKKRLLFLLIVSASLSSGYLIYNLYRSFTEQRSVLKSAGTSQIKSINLKKQ